MIDTGSVSKSSIPNQTCQSIINFLGNLPIARRNLPRVDYDKLSGDRVGESSEAVRARVQTARDIQNKRFLINGLADIVCNADMRAGEIMPFCKLQDEGQSLMRAAMTQLNLLAGAYHRIVKLARTIVELAWSEEIQSPH